MKTFLLLVLCGVLAIFNVFASDEITIAASENTPLFDGHCNDAEWQHATTLVLPADITVLLMHSKQALFVCAKGKPEDYTVIDLYIEDQATGYLHNLHASAQLSERMFKDNAWSESKFWNNKDWGGFWVPYAGEKETDKGPRTQFLTGSDREIQVLRKKFIGNTWNMTVRISGVYADGKYGAEFYYPQDAVDNNKATWQRFTFSQ